MRRINLKNETILKALEVNIKEKLKSMLNTDLEDMFEYSPIP